MNVIKNVMSQTKPEDIEEKDSMVFVHNNIREIVEEDPVFKTSKKVYVYDEVQYTYQEWYALTIKEMKQEIEELKQEIKELKLNESKQDDNVLFYKEGMTISDIANLLDVSGVELVKKVISLGIMELSSEGHLRYAFFTGA